MNSHINFSFLVIIIISFYACNVNTQPSDSKNDNRKKVEMTTNYGTMIIELYDETPLHRDNFINLVNHKAYDSLLLHRVINKFMIQGGDPNSRKAKPNDLLGVGDLPYVIEAEYNKDLFHKKGAIAAANGDSENDTSSMQFFIVHGKVYNDSLIDKYQKYINGNIARRYYKNDLRKKALLDSIELNEYKDNQEPYNELMDSIMTLANADEHFKSYLIPEEHREVYKSIGGAPYLDQSYTVYGEVIEGLNVIDSIASVATNSDDRPLKDVRILSIKILE